ncbi:PREDICTED: uncharacterized protein LOC109350396 [Lupinus angustifolius]|uniref:uncharacterized protein LOC109350396 n=1 Tax=Lupinus angustifolius TaxID=3871 RepID=UPI00092EF8BF|nr:PREDICTED: uncharacterized protein LOC109350396 [Lupinus angustifolius]
MACKMRKQVFFLWWFGMAAQLCFLLGVSAKKTSFRRNIREINSSLIHFPFTVNTRHHKQVVIDNGIVSVKLANPKGYVIGISYSGIDNLLDTKLKENNRGYVDVVWNKTGKEANTFQRVHGTRFSVITADENMVEVSFSRRWTFSMGGSSVPINIDKRYILRKNDSGFYSYIIFNRLPGFIGTKISQIRSVFKLHSRFHYMAISDTRQRNMPTTKDRSTGKTLAYPEAVRITRPSNPRFMGEVDDKYQYSTENQDNTLHGWITKDSKATVGIWTITPSNEFRNCGPIKQDLTSHLGPTFLNMFMSTHYAGKNVAMSFGQGETYKKVFGPFYTYLNSASSDAQFRSLWSDAVQQRSKEVQSWPYVFPQSKDFIPPNQRGTVAGCFEIQDRFVAIEGSQPAVNAYIGLALPGDAGSWQEESKGYQFWTRTDENGHFAITNIVPGKYNLYGWVHGFIGDYKYEAIITITPGCAITLDSLVYIPPRNGPTLWEIGIPDRSAAEFYIPYPQPRLRNNLYKNDDKEKFRQYGLWARYSDLYPLNDLVYTVGVSDYRKDWFFAHVSRSIGNTYQPTTWQIIFELQNNTLRGGDYTLQLALASASGAEVQVRLNDPGAYSPLFTTGLIGDDNAIARHGNHGLYWFYTINIPSSHLVKGTNTIYLRQARAASPFVGVMYDYIRLESPAPLCASLCM